MALSLLLTLFFSLCRSVSSHAITPAAHLPVHTWDAESNALLGALPNGWLGRRDSSLTNCDGKGVFICPIGTCYTGLDGFVGCCSVSSCAARTTCIEYDATSTSADCDPNTGGCVVCSSAAPYCVTITNTIADQYIMYCGLNPTTKTTGYTNTVTGGSIAGPPGVELTSLTSTASMTPVPKSRLSSTARDHSSGNSFSISALEAVTSSSTDTFPKQAIQSDHSSLSAGAIAGIAVGSIAAGCLILFLIFWFTLRPKWAGRNKHIGASAPNEKETPGDTPLMSDPDNHSTPHGLGINEVEGSSPESVQHPWAPSSLNQHPLSPELDSTPTNGSPAAAQQAFPPRSSSARADSTAYPGQLRYSEPLTQSSPLIAPSPSAGSTYVPYSPPLSTQSGPPKPERMTMSAAGAGPTYPTVEHALAGGPLFGDGHADESSDQTRGEAGAASS